MNKRGVSPLTYLIGIIVSLLGFFLLFSFLISSGNEVITQTEEKACQTYLKAKSTSSGEVADFLVGLNDACNIGLLESDSSEKEEVFREVSERIHSCWNRYGGGEIDFMSNYDTTGEYCFPCTKMLHEEDFNYDYNEYISWTQENGPSGTKKNYSDLINFEYFSDENNSLRDVESSLSQLQEEIEDYNEDTNTALLADLSLYITNYRNDLVSLRDKRITSGESYVVFKYKRINNSLQQTIDNTIEGAVKGGVTSLASGVVLRSVIGGPIGFASSIIRFAKTAKGAKNLIKISRKTASAMKFLKKTKKSTLAIGAVTAAGGATGGTIGSQMNYNYDQYVDIVDEEEYYRTCGPTPVVE